MALKAQSLGDLLLPFGVVAPGVILGKDGSLSASWEFRGPDLESSLPEHIDALSARLNSIMQLGSGWMIQCDAIRSEASSYPGEGAFPDPVTAVIDAERREVFGPGGRPQYETRYYLTLTNRAPGNAESRLRDWIIGKRAHGGDFGTQYLEDFEQKIAAFQNIFLVLFDGKRLDLDGQFDSQLQFYRECVTGENCPFARPEVPVYLHDLLSADFVGGEEPRVGKREITVVAVDGFPLASTPGMLHAIDQLAVPYRWNTRAILLDPEQARALLDKDRRKWHGSIISFRDQLFKTQNGAVDRHALKMLDEAEHAMGLARSGEIQFAQLSINVVVHGDTREQVDERAGQIKRTIQLQGFGARIERTNAVEAWLGTQPMDGYRNIRRSLLHTRNIADMLPLTSVWAGLTECPSDMMPTKDILIAASTTGATPYRFNLHVKQANDLGHTAVIGPSRMGKSTLLGLIAAQWFRYPRAQVFVFDRGYSMWALAAAVGGRFYDLMTDDSLQFAPLRHLAEPATAKWAPAWIRALCELNDLHFEPKHTNAVNTALVQIGNGARLSDLHMHVQDRKIQEALDHYVSGPLGSLYDAPTDSLHLKGSRFTVFETEALLKTKDPKVIQPTLLYLFHRIESRLDGSPTLLILDEAWSYLCHPLFLSRLADWLKTMAKSNVCVILASQQLSDFANSEIADIVQDNCPTKILLPNPEARTPAGREYYKALGMNETQLELIAQAMPKRQYYVCKPEGQRLVDFGITDVALSFIGVNGKEARLEVAELIKRYGARWPIAGLRQRKLDDWADYLESLYEVHVCASA